MSDTGTDDPPLTARSVLLSLLLGNRPPRAPVSLLVRTAALFGIAEGTVRTALSRMSAAGEVSADDGWYELVSERLLARQERQERSRTGRTEPWTGAWVTAVVVSDGRRPAAARSRLRDELARGRLSELREGVWMRPDNLGGRPRLDESLARDLVWMTAAPDGDDRALAARLWDLPAWAGRAEDLRRRMAALLGPLGAGDHRALADGFVTSAAVLRHVQADPLLPAGLLPDRWPGTALRDEYERYDATYRSCLATWFRADAA